MEIEPVFVMNSNLSPTYNDLLEENKLLKEKLVLDAISCGKSLFSEQLVDCSSGIPEVLVSKWQGIIDVLADLINVPAALIMKVDEDYMEVFLSSKTERNPYHSGDREKWYGLYCETVIKTQQKLLIPDALQDVNWNTNPDIKLGMVSYMGLPLNYPDKTPFGTICVLDSKYNGYSDTYIHLLQQYKQMIELDLNLLDSTRSELILKDNEIAHQKNLLQRIVENLPDTYLSIIEKDLTIAFSAGLEFAKQNLNPNDFIGLGLEQVFGEKASLVKNYYLNAFAGNECDFELFINDQYQYYRVVPLVDSDGEINRILVVVENITVQKKVEIALQEEKNNAEEVQRILESVFNNTHILFALLDHKFNFIKVNQTYAQADQKSPGFFSGKNHFELFPNKENEVIFKKVLETKEPHFHSAKAFEYEYNKERGVSFWDWSLIPVLDKNNNVDSLVLSLLDVTEKVKAVTLLRQNEKKLRNKHEELLANYDKISQINIELEQAKIKAEESDNLKSAFLANMSHEIRTPMNGIIGFSKMIMNSKLNTDKKNHYAKIVVNNSEQLLSIVDDILDISRIETGKLEVKAENIVVNNVILDLYHFFKPKAKDVSLDFSYDKRLIDIDSVVISDKTRLTQILTNLLSNAFKFTTKGYIKFGYKLVENKLQFFVEDTGIGIAEEMHGKIFDRFHQLELEMDKHQGGTGLGLSISCKLVEYLGGEMWLESEENKGSVFYFTIPYNRP